jgi:probable phosphoglycerate mutase
MAIIVAADRTDLLELRAPMARLILIRHGESIANLEGRFTVDCDEPLTPAGREQARARGEALRGRCAPTALYTSPFLRALDTAREIGLALRLEPILVEDLREQDFGVYKGQPYTAFYAHWMGLSGSRGVLGGGVSGIAEAGGVDRWELRPDGGERLRDVARRAGAALDRIARRHLGEEVVVVSHGGVMSALRAWVVDDYSRPPVATLNAGGYLLRYTGERYEGPFELDAMESSGAARG